jgi:hypothetical protein
MPKAAVAEFTGTDLLEHPAVTAWRQLYPETAAPDAVEALKEKNKSASYRLAGVGPEHSAVIAKRCLIETARVERIIYEQVLPSLPMPALRYYGCLEERDSRFLWLFLQDAGKEPYSLSDAEHTSLASRWLGLMHTSGLHIAAAAGLPERGPRHYAEHLGRARNTIQRNLNNRVLSAEDVTALQRILALCDSVESQWPALERLSEGIPATFVHGDFSEKNLRVRRTSDELVLLPFDWETAGWGVPVADLVKCPDLSLYQTVVGVHWPALAVKDLQRLARVGIVFRSLAGLQWESLYLQYEWAGHHVSNLLAFETRLNNALRALELKAIDQTPAGNLDIEYDQRAEQLA